MRFPFARWTVVFAVFVASMALSVAWLPAQEDTTEEAPEPLPAAEKQIKEVTDAFELFRTLKFDLAMSKLKEACAAHPELPPAEVIMSNWFIRVNPPQPAAARGMLERAASEVPDDPQAYLILGEIALSEGRVAEADLLYGKASTLLPGMQNEERKKAIAPGVEAGLAAVAESGLRQDWETAKKHLEAWLKLDPESTNAMQRLARALFQLKDSAGALDQFKAAKTANPKVLNPSAALAQLYHQAGDQKNAKTWMEYALQMASKDLSTVLVATRWYLDTEQFDQAELQAKAAMQIDPGSLDAKILRGVIALFKKDFSAAETYFESAVSQSPGSFVASNNLALALCEQEPDTKKRKALEYADKNVRLYSKSRDAASTYGWVLYKYGRLREADNVLIRLARSGRVDADTAYYIARVAAELGRKDEAKTVLQSALKSTRPFYKKDEAQALVQELGP